MIYKDGLDTRQITDKLFDLFYLLFSVAMRECTR